MNHHYADIRTRLGEPTWFDEHAVPRYCSFAPAHLANIYADEAALVEIECQSCSMQFEVAFSWSLCDAVMPPFSWDSPLPCLAWQIVDRSLHYGDPPNVRCCPAGPTMNSVPRRVRQYWRSRHFTWERVGEREIPLDDAVPQ